MEEEGLDDTLGKQTRISDRDGGCRIIAQMAGWKCGLKLNYAIQILSTSVIYLP